MQTPQTSELTEYQKFIIESTCTNPRIVSADKNIVETFTLQLLFTLFL